MKTSIIISSVAALCLMITIAETPSDISKDNSKFLPVNPVAYFTTNKASTANKTIADADLNKTKEFKMVDLARIMSYLKFDVSQYSNETEEVSDEITDTNYDYLKFNPTDYNSVTEIMPEDATNNVQDDLEYLKFNVADYNSVTEIIPEDASNNEKNDLEYLKFNAADYTSVTEIMPEDVTNNVPKNFEYLKFDVNKYYNQKTDIVLPSELPVSEQN